MPLKLGVCPEKDRLINEYRLAAESLSQAVTELHNRMSTVRRAEYERLRTVTEERQTELEQVRHALDLHLVEHNC